LLDEGHLHDLGSVDLFSGGNFGSLLLLVELIATKFMPKLFEILILFLSSIPLDAFVLLLGLCHHIPPVFVLEFLLNFSHILI
jgi:hypothetical protein